MQIITWSGLLTSAQPETDSPTIKRSGCQNATGFEIELCAETGQAKCYLDLAPGHLNSHGILHGGIIAMILDVACGNTASAYFDRVEHPLVLTVSLNTNYIGAVREGRVIAKGKPAGGGRNLCYVNGEMHHQDGTLIATATGVFKRHSKAK